MPYLETNSEEMLSRFSFSLNEDTHLHPQVPGRGSNLCTSTKHLQASSTSNFFQLQDPTTSTSTLALYVTLIHVNSSGQTWTEMNTSPLSIGPANNSLPPGPPLQATLPHTAGRSKASYIILFHSPNRKNWGEQQSSDHYLK